MRYTSYFHNLYISCQRVFMSVFMSVSLYLCACVCVSVCVHKNSKNNSSIHLKLEHTVMYENNSNEFDIGHSPFKVKEQRDFVIIIYLP